MAHRGLYGKYRVERSDGKPTKRGDAFYVLNYGNDPEAREALRRLAQITRNSHLRRDLTRILAAYHDNEFDDEEEEHDDLRFRE